MGVVLPGEADAAQHLDAVLGGGGMRLERDRPGGGQRGIVIAARVAVEGGGGVQATARACSSPTSMSAQRCFTAWNWPIEAAELAPVRAWAAATSTHHAAPPAASAAARATPTASTAPGPGRAPARQARRPGRGGPGRVGSRGASGVAVAPARSTTAQRSSPPTVTGTTTTSATAPHSTGPVLPVSRRRPSPSGCPRSSRRGHGAHPPARRQVGPGLGRGQRRRPRWAASARVPRRDPGHRPRPPAPRSRSPRRRRPRPRPTRASQARPARPRTWRERLGLGLHGGPGHGGRAAVGEERRAAAARASVLADGDAHPRVEHVVPHDPAGLGGREGRDVLHEHRGLGRPSVWGKSEPNSSRSTPSRLLEQRHVVLVVRRHPHLAPELLDRMLAEGGASCRGRLPGCGAGRAPTWPRSRWTPAAAPGSAPARRGRSGRRTCRRCRGRRTPPAGRRA